MYLCGQCLSCVYTLHIPGIYLTLFVTFISIGAEDELLTLAPVTVNGMSLTAMPPIIATAPSPTQTTTTTEPSTQTSSTTQSTTSSTTTSATTSSPNTTATTSVTGVTTTTTTETTTTTTPTIPPTSATSGTGCLCKTGCNGLSDDLIAKRLADIVNNLTIRKNSTGATRRKRTSAGDDRQSSAAVGSMAVCLLGGLLAVIVLVDVRKLWRDLRGKNTVHARSQQQG